MFELFLKLPNKTLTKHVFQNYCTKATKPKSTDVNLPFTKKKCFGQPTYESHPHLLNKGEVTPLIQQCEYQERRQKLIESVADHATKRNKDLKHHLIIIPSSSKQYMSDKIPYVFRQNTDFLYMTGCQEPDSCLVLSTAESPSQHRVTLFLRDKDEHSEKWDGPRTGSEEAIELFGVDQALPMSELENYLQFYMKSHRSSTLWFDNVYVCRYDYMTPVQSTVHKVMCDYLNEIINKMWESPKPFIHKLRVFKSPAEVALLQKSCDVASEAFIKTITASKPGISEHQIFAQVDYECRMRGAEFLAYPPVVAGGDRANTIHYINNNQIVAPGEMVLMDAGCEYHGYSSDITRTWPISGTFTPAQRALYEIVLNVQLELINLCNNFPTLDELFDSMSALLGKKLKEIGVISANTTNQMLLKAVYDLCPHHVSHYLGMDVHDTSLIPRNIRMLPGMVITVEPGLYIGMNNDKVPKEFRGMGIRIEDDVLITEDGPVVLSKKCPKSVADIENLAKNNV